MRQNHELYDKKMTNLNQTILKYNALVPRYTSYPTAPHFSDKVGNTDYTKWLKALPKKANISLYLHIPFCAKLCWYCGCHTKATNKYEPVEAYIKLLKREIKIVSNALKDKRNVTHIHFGGGSPTILKPADFSDVMQVIRDNFVIDNKAEIAMELDPRGVTESKIMAYTHEGINRVSIGVQDFHQNVQEAINRDQPFHTIYDSVKLLREYGINHINMDLMYGLPHQTIDSIKENISYALLFKPDRIAFFGYAHVPWMKKQMRLIDESTLPNSEERLEMFQVGAEKLQNENYNFIGLDHFVKKADSMEKALNKGKLRRNFQGYTTDNAEALIGLGVSSISKLPQGYVQNVMTNKEYETVIMNDELASIKGIEINDDDILRHDIIEQIMTYMEVDIAKICESHNADISQFDNVFEELKPLIDDGLIEISEHIIRINKNARQATRFVSAAFDKYYTNQANRHAQVA